MAVKDMVRAVEGVKAALDNSHLVECAKRYSVALKTGVSSAEARHAFLHAFNHFWQTFDRFDKAQQQLAHTLELKSILNQGLWKRLVAEQELPAQAKLAIQQIHLRLSFAQAHLCTLEKSLLQLQRDSDIRLPENGDTFVFAGRRAGDWVPPREMAVYRQNFMVAGEHEMPARAIACFLGGIRRVFDCCAEFVERPGAELKLLKFEAFPQIRAAFYGDEAVLGVVEQVLEDLAVRIPSDPEELTLDSIEALVEEVPLLDAMHKLLEIGKFDQEQMARMHRRMRRGLWLFLAGGAVPGDLPAQQLPALQVIAALANAELTKTEAQHSVEWQSQQALSDQAADEDTVSVAERLSPSKYLQAIEHFYGGDLSHTLSGMGSDDYYADEYDPVPGDYPAPESIDLESRAHLKR